MEETYILNFFTDAGLLPNYAFPEEGVTLRAVVTGLPVTQPEDKRYVVYEYLRAAGVALQELAPYNTFYAQGRKLIIDRVAIPGRDQSLERWQFCDRCSHLARVQTSHYSKVCPLCGSPGWNDLGQQQTMVPLHQVGSTGTHHGSQIGDDDDERDRERYQIVPTFTLDPAFATGAHLIPSLPFGFEYFTEATLHEVNFGLTTTPGQKVQIAGEERPATGFRLCRDCGAVPLNQEEDAEKLQIHHAHNCPVRLGKRPVEWETVYLYRTLTSEALRLLLPVSTTMADEKLATFAAALQLGLRLHLGGAPDHLRIVRYSEIGPDNVRRHYLMIYDTVPGGTSYLRDLARPATLHTVLRKALAALVSCECRGASAKAACYRCLYTYADQRRLALMSRKLGVELLQAVLSQWSALQASHSLADADLHSVLESELELLFVTALGEQLAKQPKAQWQPLLYNGKPGWRLTLDQQQWIVEPQVLLDTTHGVAVSSRADFVCWPQTSQADGRRPVAIFTDGYAYHVQPTKARGTVGDDLHKRRALVASGRFWVWSLTWDDVEEYQKEERFSLPSFIGTQPEKLVATLAGNDAARLLLTNGVQQLLAHLANPTVTRWQTLAQTLPVAALLPPRPPTTSAVIAAKVDMLCNDPALPNLSLAATLPSGSLHYAMIEHYYLAWLATLDKSALQQRLFAQVQLVLRLEDNQQERSSNTFKQGWRWFWLFHNLLQFAGGFRPVTAEYVRYHGGSAAIPTTVTVPPPVTGTGATDNHTTAWQEAFDYSDARCRPLLEAAQAATLPPPTPGYELTDARGRVTAQAELAWEAQQIAILLPDPGAAAGAAFTTAGWQCFTLDDAAAIIAACKATG